MDSQLAKAALEAHGRGEDLPNEIKLALAQRGYVRLAEVTNQDTPAGEREYLITFLTQKAAALLATDRE